MGLAGTRSIHAGDGRFRDRLCVPSWLPAFKDVAKLGERAAKRIDAMGKPLTQQDENDAPFFTRPLQDVTERYTNAHTEVIERREAKRNRHAQQWAQWRHFND